MAYDISSWGLKSSPKDSIPKIIENFRALKEDGIVSPSMTYIYSKTESDGRYSPSGYGLGGTNSVISGTNVLIPRNTGFYMGDGMLNAPNNASSWFYFEYQRHNDLFCSIIATSLFNNEKWTCNSVSGTWLPWERQIISKDPVFNGNLQIFNAGGSAIVAGNTSGGYASLGISDSTNSVARLEFTNQLSLIGGNVGIGTTTPQATLHSTGSTILGAGGVAWSQLGNQQVSIGIDQLNSKLQIVCKYTDGTQCVAYVPLSLA